jgi:hypothetical protein
LLSKGNVGLAAIFDGGGVEGWPREVPAFSPPQGDALLRNNFCIPRKPNCVCRRAQCARHRSTSATHTNIRNSTWIRLTIDINVGVDNFNVCTISLPWDLWRPQAVYGDIVPLEPFKEQVRVVDGVVAEVEQAIDGPSTLTTKRVKLRG